MKKLKNCALLPGWTGRNPGRENGCFFKRLKNIIGAAVFLAFVTQCTGIQEENSVENYKKYCLEEGFKKRVQYEKANTLQVTSGIPLTGSVESNPDKVIHFVSLVGGIITQTYFSLGDEVKKGQLLAEMRSAELNNLQSEKKSLQSRIRVAERQLESVTSMYEDNIASKKDLVEAESELNILKAELEKVTADLSLYSAAAEKGVFQIRAPAAGIITHKNITAGMQIASDDAALFTIADLSEIWILLNIYAGNVTSIEPGLKVDIRTLSYPAKVFKGSIGALSQVFDTEERVIKGRVVMKNPELLLKPGMLVDAMVIQEKDMQAVAIPTNALVFDNNQNYVVIYRDDCDLEIRNVELLTRSNGTTFISDGILDGEQVITKNNLLIYEQIKNFQQE
ncbi:MAG: efflux RND transporter periplasmic adaptor subunit [Cyclobacteriaceae bacterium]|nr:efflux RND transporter periplasmic adaptor subunit [Cyclobacteriaceae bacterium]